jgi:hypothetical protein
MPDDDNDYGDGDGPATRTPRDGFGESSLRPASACTNTNACLTIMGGAGAETSGSSGTGNIHPNDGDGESKGERPPLSLSSHPLESLPSGLIVNIIQFLCPSSHEVLRIAGASGRLNDKLVSEWGGWECKECREFTFFDGVHDPSRRPARWFMSPIGGGSRPGPPCTSRYALSACEVCASDRWCFACTPICGMCEKIPCMHRHPNRPVKVTNFCPKRLCEHKHMCSDCRLECHCHLCHENFCPRCDVDPESESWLPWCGEDGIPYCLDCHNHIRRSRYKGEIQDDDDDDDEVNIDAERCTECGYPVEFL